MFKFHQLRNPMRSKTSMVHSVLYRVLHPRIAQDLQSFLTKFWPKFKTNWSGTIKRIVWPSGKFVIIHFLWHNSTIVPRLPALRASTYNFSTWRNYSLKLIFNWSLITVVLIRNMGKLLYDIQLTHLSSWKWDNILWITCWLLDSSSSFETIPGSSKSLQ